RHGYCGLNLGNHCNSERCEKWPFVTLNQRAFTTLRAEPLILNLKDCATSLKIPLGTPASLSATTLLPGQDNSGPSEPTSRSACSVVSSWVSLSEVGFSEIRKPHVISGRLHFMAMRRGVRNAAKIEPPIQIPFPHHIEHGQKHGQNGGSEQKLTRGGV